jgi:hypothetical protein
MDDIENVSIGPAYITQFCTIRTKEWSMRLTAAGASLQPTL